MMAERIAHFILGFCDQGVSSELPIEEHVEVLVDEIKKIKESNPSLYYYLENATCNYDGESMEE